MTAPVFYLCQALTSALRSVCARFAGLMLMVLAVCGGGVSSSQAGEVLETDFARAELLSAVETTGQLDDIPLGLQVILRPGWKIYWRSPGDAGLPTRLILDQTSPAGQTLTMDYPLPARFSLFGLDTYGYGDRVVFPVRLEGHRPGQPLFVRAFLDALVCSDICVPFSGPLSARLPAGVLKPSVDAQTIARAAARVPRLAAGRDLSVRSVSYDASQTSLFVQLDRSGTAMQTELDDIFVETEAGGLSFARPVKTSSGLYQIKISGAVDNLVLADQSVRLTLVKDGQFAEQTLPVSPARAPSPDRPSLGLMILLALAGGLILNIMPCVLPVLSLKLTSILSMTASQPRYIRTRLLTGAAGILTSFAVLTAGLVMLKATGARLGWGIQFQNLYFLSAMVVFLGLFTLILLDKLTLPTPHIGGRQRDGHLMSDFMSGFLATLLATPCSAPLVGTAVSFALSGTLLDIILILMMMGVGLALPWLVLAFAPHLVLMMPKPGPWLGYVRPVLAAGLVLTILWLLWLISVVSTASLAAGLAAGLVILWGLARFAPPTVVWPSVAGVMVMAVVMTGWVNTTLYSDSQTTAGNNAVQALWQPWSADRLADLTGRRQPVFVDVTADWCVTCKVNKQLVLDRASVQQAFRSAGVILLRADWTRPDEAIADYLLSYGRFGIPFNALYLPGQPEPVIFSELLSAEKILASLESSRL